MNRYKKKQLSTLGAEAEERKFDLSPAEVIKLTWHVSQFILEMGHRQTGETILQALNTTLMKVRLIEND
jgi:hypothetical protein